MPFDPDAYLKQKDQQKAFDPDAYLKSSQPGSGLIDPLDVGKGVAQGVARYGVGAGQIAEHLFPGTAAGVRSIPGVSSAAHAAKEFALEPHETWGQSIGDVAGTAAPWVAGALTGVDEAAGGAYLASRAAPYLGRFAGPLSEFAAKTGFGAASGGLEATKSGDLKSHLKGAEVGAAAGAVTTPRIAGPAAGVAGGAAGGWGIQELARTIGWEPTLGIISALGLGGHLGHLGLYALARRAAAAARKPGAIISNKLPGGFVGGEAGKAVGGSSDERSQ